MSLERRRAAGSALILAIVLLALAAIAAGTLFPAFHTISRQEREDTTRRNLDEVAAGLAAYQRDVGVFPPGNDASGLGRLLFDAAPGWRGPYLSERGRARDGFGHPLAYRRGGPGFSLAIVVGPGADGAVQSALAGFDAGAWGPVGDDDGRRVVGDADPRQLQADRLVENLAEAVRSFRARTGAYPPSLQTLVDGGYVSPAELLDAWGRPIRYRVDARDPNTAFIWSHGLDGASQDGRGDDVGRLVGVEPPVEPFELLYTNLSKEPGHGGPANYEIQSGSFSRGLPPSTIGSGSNPVLVPGTFASPLCLGARENNKKAATVRIELLPGP